MPYSYNRQAAGFDLLDQSDDMLARMRKAMLKEAEDIVKTATQRLLGHGLKVTNSSVYLDRDGKPAYSFHITDMRAEYENPRSNEDAEAHARGALGYGGHWSRGTRAGTYEMFFEHR